jgi:ankyrin repeat protein
LKDCLDYPSLRQALSTLPKTLDDTYARILENIPEGYSTQIATVLNLLIWSGYHNFKISELVDAVATNFEKDPAFDPKNRMPVPRDILRLCSSLITVYRAPPFDREFVSLAHSSVKEYLVSNRVSKGFEFLGCETVAKSYLTRLFLRHLIGVSQFTLRGRLVRSIDIQEIHCDFPFVDYSARTWMNIAREVVNEDESLFNSVLSFFQEEEEAFYLFSEVYDYGRTEEASPLYYAADGGMTRMIEYLLARGADVNAKDSAALRVALYRGRDTTVQLLLQRGARVDTENDEVFQDAMLKCHDTTVQSLIERCGNTAAENESIMSAAVRYGRESIVRWLLDRGVSVSAANGWSLSSDPAPKIVTTLRFLLDRGTDVDAGDGRLLREASRHGLHKTVKLLLRRGASPNAHGQSTPTALEEVLEQVYHHLVLSISHYFSRIMALRSSPLDVYYKIAQLLVDKGADATFSGGEWLQTLRAGGWSVQTVQQILEKDAPLRQDHILSAMYDADPQAETIVSAMLPYLSYEVAAPQGRDRMNLLHHAASSGSVSVTRKCLDLGVGVHTEAGSRTALHYAADFGYLTIVKMLVLAGSDIKALDHHNKTPLAYAQDTLTNVWFLNRRRASGKKASRHKVIAYLSDLSLNAGPSVGIAISQTEWTNTNRDKTSAEESNAENSSIEDSSAEDSSGEYIRRPLLNLERFRRTDDTFAEDSSAEDSSTEDSSTEDSSTEDSAAEGSFRGFVPMRPPIITPEMMANRWRWHRLT